MKTLIPLTLALALAATGTSHAQEAFSKPSGYVTETLKGDGAFNLIGITLHETVVANGTLTSVASTKVTDTTKDFTALLTAGNTYVFQLKGGSQDGGIQVVDNWGTSGGGSTGDLFVSDNLSAVGVVAGTAYELRAAATLSSLFGAANESGLKSGSILSADVVWIPTGSGFAKFYYSPASTFPVASPAGWKNSSGGDAANQPIVFTDAIFIQRRGEGDLKLTLTGEVKTTRTQVFAGASQFNYVSSVFPVGTTLATSGLETTLKSGSILSGDVIWMQNLARTGYSKFYFSPATTFPVAAAAGWKNSAGADAGSQPLTSGIIIQRRGTTDVGAPIDPPTSYTNL